MAAVVFIALGCSDVSTVGGVLGTCDLDTGISEIKPRRVVATLLKNTTLQAMFCLRRPGVFCAYRQASTRRVFALRFSSSKAYAPLRILFCGSDEFSIASLKALHAVHLQHPERIASIDVVCRPAKRVGRGRNIVREGSASILYQRQ